MRRLTRIERAAVYTVAAVVEYPTGHSRSSENATVQSLISGGPRISDPRRHDYIRAVWRIAAERETYRPTVG